MTTHQQILLFVTVWLYLLFVRAAPISGSDSSSSSSLLLRGTVGTTATPVTFTSLLSSLLENIRYPSNVEEEEEEEKGEKEEGTHDIRQYYYDKELKFGPIEEHGGTELMYLERYVEDGDYYFIYDYNYDIGDGSVDDYDYQHDEKYDTNEEEFIEVTQRYLQKGRGGYGRGGKGGRGGGGGRYQATNYRQGRYGGGRGRGRGRGGGRYQATNYRQGRGGYW